MRDSEDIKDTLERILTIVQDLQVRQDRSEKELIEINKKIDSIQQSTAHMDSHIEMVDGVYHRVKEPFFAVMNYANTCFNSNTKAVEDQSSDIAEDQGDPDYEIADD